MTDRQRRNVNIARAKRARIDRAIREIVAAWTDAGRVPEYHRACQKRLKKEWPCLANAIKSLVKEK